MHAVHRIASVQEGAASAFGQDGDFDQPPQDLNQPRSIIAQVLIAAEDDLAALQKGKVAGPEWLNQTVGAD
jgi:hypothetical protein